MRITESQLRRIIREEVRALRESIDFDGPAGEAAQDIAGMVDDRLRGGELLDLIDRAARDYGVDPRSVEEHLRALASTHSAGGIIMRALGG